MEEADKRKVLNGEVASTATTDHESVKLLTLTSLAEIKNRAADCTALVSALTQKLKSKEISTAEGMSFLEVKNHLMLQYLLGVTGVVFSKIKHGTIKGSPFIAQLVEIRTVLEKIKPIDQKLKYQIDKLLRNYSQGKVEADPLKHRANLDSLDDIEDDGSSDEEDVTPRAKKDVYCPPKVAPLPYDDDDEAPAKQIEKVRKKSINKTLIRELQEEFLDTPLEIHNKGDSSSMQNSRQEREKQRFEETYMTRLPVTKKEKHSNRAISTMGMLGDEITDFKARRSPGNSSSNKRKKSSKGKAASARKKFRKK